MNSIWEIEKRFLNQYSKRMIRKPIYLVIIGIILITYASINLAEQNTIYYYSTSEILNLASVAAYSSDVIDYKNKN